MEAQINAALKALMMCKKKMKGEELLGHDNMKVMLQIAAIKVAPGTIKQTIKLPLPAPFRESEEVCLLVKDLKRGIRVDHEKSHRHWREFVDDAGVTRVTEVMPLRQLKAEYSMYEAKRKLCDAYDVFLTDVRIARLLPKLLGKHFIAKKKQPVAINMESKDLKAEIDGALDATYLHLYNLGDSSAVQVGRAGQSRSELRRNITAVVETLKHKFPGGMQNVRSLHLKLHTSPALPIFVSDVLAGNVAVPAARYQPGSRRDDVTGELSTLRADSDVTISRHGDVTVTQKRPLSDDEELTDEEEANKTHDRRSRTKKLTKKPAKPSSNSTEKSEDPTSAAPVDDNDTTEKEDEDKDVASEADSSDGEDGELEAREQRFLQQLEVQKVEQTTQSPAVAKAAADAANAKAKRKGKKQSLKKKAKVSDSGDQPPKTKKVKTEKKVVGVVKKSGKSDVSTTPVKKTSKKLKGSPAKVSPTVKNKSPRSKDYSKKTTKSITKVKKVKQKRV